MANLEKVYILRGGDASLLKLTGCVKLRWPSGPHHLGAAGGECLHGGHGGQGTGRQQFLLQPNVSCNFGIPTLQEMLNRCGALLLRTILTPVE